MSEDLEPYQLQEILLEKIKQNGGFVNAHAHFDRAFSLTADNFALSQIDFQKKWALNLEIQRKSTTDQIYDRMARAVEVMLDQGVQAIGTFIDVDPITKDKSILAAQKIRDRYSQIPIKFINQTLKGLMTKEALEWFEIGAEFVDIIGGLPSKDQGHESEHLDILLSTGKKLGKMVHVHVDQCNLPTETETELLSLKTIQHQMQGRVVGIHGISIAAHDQKYRQKIYQLMKQAELMMIANPIAYIDDPRKEIMTVIHNSVTPIDEMVPAGITIGLGTDNINDLHKPFTDGNMWTELRFLLESARFYDMDKLAEIATINGLKVLGIKLKKDEKNTTINTSISFRKGDMTKLSTPFYDPKKTYEDNYQQGPFGDFADGKVLVRDQEPQFEFCGFKVHQPFGIPAGPLVNANFIKAAFDHGFDLCVYKTVRSQFVPCHPYPNILAVKIDGDLTLSKANKQLVANQEYSQPLSITNSFGVPSMEPKVWQKDMKKAIAAAGEGQLLIASFQGTKKSGGTVADFIDDYVTTAKLVKATGAQVLEANLSCPNEGKVDLLCFDLENVEKIVRAVKKEIGSTPLLLKLAYFEDQQMLENLVKKVGPLVQGFSAINTIPSTIVDQQGKQALPGKGRERSGVCGAGIKWAGLEMTQRLADLRKKYNLNFAIVGVGGVLTKQDFDQYRQAGADAVMSATGAMWNPNLAPEISQLENNYFDQQKFNNFVLDQGIVGFFPRPIKLVSGRFSSWYVNWRNVAGDVFLLDQLSDFLLSFVASANLEFDCFYGTPDGATKLAVLAQYKWAKSQPNYADKHFCLPMGRKTPKDHGEAKDRFFVGAPEGKVIVLEDVTTTGGSLLKSVNNLLDAGIEVVAAIALTNRNELMDDGLHVSQALAKRGVNYLAMSEGVSLLPLALNRIKGPILEEFKQYGQKELKF